MESRHLTTTHTIVTTKAHIELRAEGEVVATVTISDGRVVRASVLNERGSWWRRARHGLALILGRGTNYEMRVEHWPEQR